MMRLFRKIRMWQKHHKIELFGAIVCAICVLLMVDCGSILLYAKNEDNDVLTNQAIYASEFTTSLSGVTGNISQVYVNEEGTKCGILLHFDDMTNIVTDALSYQIYVKGFNVSKGKYASETLSYPTGGYYVFGSTGYALIYLVDNNGFANQALECIVRCNDTINMSSNSSTDVAELKSKDGSYANYDQFRIVINPAGKLASKVSFLDDFDVTSLYQDAVVNESEAEIRETLKEDIVDLNTALKAINNYRNNLIDLNVKVPNLPSIIAGDEFYFDEDGTTLIYKPDEIFANGVDIDWYHTDLQTGNFLTQDLIGVKTPLQFFGDLSAAEVQPLEVPGTFYMVDGTEVKEESNSELTDIASISTNIQNYRDALNEYYRLKKNYQTIDLMKYLYLEYNMLNTGKHFTSNYNENTVIVW